MLAYIPYMDPMGTIYMTSRSACLLAAIRCNQHGRGDPGPREPAEDQFNSKYLSPWAKRCGKLMENVGIGWLLQQVRLFFASDRSHCPISMVLRRSCLKLVFDLSIKVSVFVPRSESSCILMHRMRI
jgi:hypothetical protein